MCVCVCVFLCTGCSGVINNSAGPQEHGFFAKRPTVRSNFKINAAYRYFFAITWLRDSRFDYERGCCSDLLTLQKCKGELSNCSLNSNNGSWKVSPTILRHSQEHTVHVSLFYYRNTHDLRRPAKIKWRTEGKKLFKVSTVSGTPSWKSKLRMQKPSK